MVPQSFEIQLNPEVEPKITGNMLFTEQYIFLAFPKTGSSFLRGAVKSAGVPFGRTHAFMPNSLRPKNLYYEQLTQMERPPYGYHQHGKRTQIQIPPLSASGFYQKQLQKWKANKNRQVVSIWRDPLERMISIYRYQHWATYEFEEEKAKLAKSIAPHFPDMSLAELYELNRQTAGIEKRFSLSQGNMLGISPGGWQFIQFFASEPLLAELNRRWPANAEELLEKFLLDTREIKFLEQRFLTQEITNLFSGTAYEIDPNFLERKVNVTQRDHNFKSRYEITEDDHRFIEAQEAFLYAFWERRSSEFGDE